MKNYNWLLIFSIKGLAFMFLSILASAKDIPAKHQSLEQSISQLKNKIKDLENLDSVDLSSLRDEIISIYGNLIQYTDDVFDISETIKFIKQSLEREKFNFEVLETNGITLSHISSHGNFLSTHLDAVFRCFPQNADSPE
jgi:hypothetical protein